jgi:hypothetical protein
LPSLFLFAEKYCARVADLALLMPRSCPEQAPPAQVFAYPCGSILRAA